MGSDSNSRLFLLEVARSQTCPKLLKRFVSLPSGRDRGLQGTPQAGLALTSGNLYIDNCTPTNDGGALAIRLGGVGWTWVPQEARDAGKTMWVIPKGTYLIGQQHVYFRASATIQGTVTADYEPTSGIASFWLTPSGVPTLPPEFFALSGINAAPVNFWASIWSNVLPQKVKNSTVQESEQEGRQRFAEAVSHGATLTYQPRTGQMDMLLGSLPPGVVPQRWLATPRWFLNERQELHEGGLHFAGPYPRTNGPVALAMDIEAGSDLWFTMECAANAERLVAQLTGGQQFSSGSGQPMTRVQPGTPFRNWITPPPCDWVFITTAQGFADARVALLPPP